MTDTRDKRFSALATGRPWVPTAPNPDGDISPVLDRQHIAWAYSGIEAGAAVTPASGSTSITFATSGNATATVQASGSTSITFGAAIRNAPEKPKSVGGGFRRVRKEDVDPLIIRAEDEELLKFVREFLKVAA